MNLIFCMAGLYRRFREAGYSKPKFLLPWHGHTVLRHIAGELLASGAFDQVLLVANRRDLPYRDRIETELSPLGIGRERLVFIDDTAGQAMTAQVGITLLDTIAAPSDRRIVFHNIDTLVRRRDLVTVAAQLNSCDGWIDTFSSHDPAFSYVRTSPEGLVTEIAEKRVISDQATSGLYAFADADAFSEMARTMDSNPGERYISDIYRKMLDRGDRIAVGEGTCVDDTLIFGTPQQYEQLAL